MSFLDNFSPIITPSIMMLTFRTSIQQKQFWFLIVSSISSSSSYLKYLLLIDSIFIPFVGCHLWFLSFLAFMYVFVLSSESVIAFVFVILEVVYVILEVVFAGFLLVSRTAAGCSPIVAHRQWSSGPISSYQHHQVFEDDDDDHDDNG